MQWRRHNYAPQPDTKDPTPPTDLPFLHRAVKLYHTGHGTGDHRDHLGRFRCAPNDSVIILETHGMFFRFWMCGLSCFSWPRATIHKRASMGWGGGDSTVNFFFFYCAFWWESGSCFAAAAWIEPPEALRSRSHSTFSQLKTARCNGCGSNAEVLLKMCSEKLNCFWLKGIVHPQM